MAWNGAGNGTVMEVGKKIIGAIDKLDKSTTRLNKIMIWLTVVLVFLSVVLVWLTYKLAFS